MGLELVATAAASEELEGEAGADMLSFLALCSAARARSFSILAVLFFLSGGLEHASEDKSGERLEDQACPQTETMLDHCCIQDERWPGSQTPISCII